LNKIANAQSYIEGIEVAEMGVQFLMEFKDIYPASTTAFMLTVGPMQSFVGLAIKNGHLVPAAEVAELREQLATAAKALEKLISYNEDIAAGRINYRPFDHIAVAKFALPRSEL